MYLVKLSYPQEDATRWGSFMRQIPGNSGMWGGYKFISNEDIPECDYWVVCDQIPKTETCKCPKENTIFITEEPPQIGADTKSFLDQFRTIITCHPDIIRNSVGKNIFRTIQCPPWIINKTYDELNIMGKLDKPKTISLITSRKYKKRYTAALRLKEYFGDRLDIFGDGSNPIKDKWDALAPYKYTIAMENFRVDDYITEKLFDCYLTHTYPFYWGCPNADHYYPKESYTEIDINNIDETIGIIESVINNQNHYIQSLPYLESSKRLTMNTYNIFVTIIRCINLFNLNPAKEKIEITISDKNRFWKDKMIFLKKLKVAYDNR